MIQYSNLGKYGRLGNALFELASTAGIGHQRGEPVRFNADWIHRPYFSVPDELYGCDPNGTEATNLPEVAHIDPRVRPYMQDYGLFKPIMNKIRTWFAPSDSAKRELDRFEVFHELPRPRLGVHVRRGDYVPGQDPTCPDRENYYIFPWVSYYLNAIAMFRHSAASIAVFSDEPDWCMNNLPGDYFHQGVPHPKEHEPDFATAPVLDWIDLQLMAQCDYHVVTGSTYGIWAALLARPPSDSLHVVRATPVYGPKLSFINEDVLFPSHWIKMEAKGAPTVRPVGAEI